jgi:outer membrane protein OmpA-like peptidoglycan-associated protein
MSSQNLVPHWRALLAALGCVLVVGCSTAPPSVPTPNPTEAKISALRSLGFEPGNDGWELNLAVKLLFESDVGSVSDEGREAVAELARTLSALGIERIRIEGHTDNLGNAKYNETLSLRRAESVAQHLVRIGWRDSAIERRGYGADKPVADNATPSGRAQNRRVAIAVKVE